MKKLKSLYIGLKKDTSNGVEYLKGFIVEDGTTKAHIANKIKVDNWRDKTIEPLLIDNSPMNGYSVKEVLSLRSSRGNNKCRIQVTHPLGFDFWLSPKSLENILLKSKLDNGKILDSMIVVMDGEISIVPESTEIIPPVKPKPLQYLKQSELVLGGIYRDSYASYINLGKVNVLDMLTGEVQFKNLYAQLSYNRQISNYILQESTKKFITDVGMMVNVNVELQRFQDKSNYINVSKNDSYSGIVKKLESGGIFGNYNGFHTVIHNDQTILFKLESLTEFEKIGVLTFKYQETEPYNLYISTTNGISYKITKDWLMKKGIIKR